jgi:hypothetical protein
MSVKLAGDTALDDFRANSVSLTQSPGFDRNTNQLLSWKTLSLRGLQVSMAPNAPPNVDVRETTLTDFFARVIVDPTGRLNLLNLTKKGEAEANAAAAAAATPARARARAAPPPRPAQHRSAAEGSGGAPVSAENMVGGSPEPAKPRPRGARRHGAGRRGRRPQARHQLRPDEPGQRQDRLHRPVRQAQLLGRPQRADRQAQLLLVEPARSGPGGRPALADLELRGKAQQTAALEILGKLNPLAKPLALDITGQGARPRAAAAVAVLGQATRATASSAAR